MVAKIISHCCFFLPFAIHPLLPHLLPHLLTPAQAEGLGPRDLHSVASLALGCRSSTLTASRLLLVALHLPFSLLLDRGEARKETTSASEAHLSPVLKVSKRAHGVTHSLLHLLFLLGSRVQRGRENLQSPSWMGTETEDVNL